MEIKSLIGKQFEVDPLAEMPFDLNHYTYTIEGTMGNHVLITWTDQHNQLERTTYTKEEVLSLIGDGTWILL